MTSANKFEINLIYIKKSEKKTKILNFLKNYVTVIVPCMKG